MIIVLIAVGGAVLLAAGFIARAMSARPASRLASSTGDPAGQRVRELEATGDVGEAIRARLAAGQKLEAIKLYRAKTGASLEQAKAAISAIEATRAPAEGVAAVVLSPEVRAFLSKGDYVGAIKQYRSETGATLEQAKAAVAPLEHGDDRTYLSRIGHN